MRSLNTEGARGMRSLHTAGSRGVRSLNREGSRCSNVKYRGFTLGVMRTFVGRGRGLGSLPRDAGIVCQAFAISGSCPHRSHCRFSHLMPLALASVDVISSLESAVVSSL